MTAFTTLPFWTCPSGAASLTLAVITSPRPARRPVPPPSGRIICSLRAPEVSATSSMVLIITAIVVSCSAPPVVDPQSFDRQSSISTVDLAGGAGLGIHRGLGHERGLAHDLFQLPALQPRKRARLLDRYHIADV